MNNRPILCFISLFIMFSCSTQKDVLLLQDSKNLEEFDIQYKTLTVKPDDILKVKVASQSPEISQLFSYDSGQESNLTNYQINGFVVNSSGYLKIPLLEPLKVDGLTLNEISVLIQKSLTEKGLLLNSTVDVKLLNAYFTVLGEVNAPGRYHFIDNEINLLNALGTAGDLTINGKRSDIRILRNVDNALRINSVDITSSQFLTSNYFQILPGDIIIVSPNRARVKNAGIIGNSGNLLSVLSFILSSIILITSTN